MNSINIVDLVGLVIVVWIFIFVIWSLLDGLEFDMSFTIRKSTNGGKTENEIETVPPVIPKAGESVAIEIQEKETAPPEQPAKVTLPFWEDLDQLEAEQDRILEGGGSEGVIDSLSYARQIAEAITELKERNIPPAKK